MNTPGELLEPLVQNWLTDVQRRGAELYAVNRTDRVWYLSFAGKNRLRFSLEIDFSLRDITVEINSPSQSSTERRVFLLNGQSLRHLANKMCLVKEGQAAVPVYLLARLAILCHAYQRLVAEYDREHRLHSSSSTVQELEAELRNYLTSEEQRRTDNPYLKVASTT
jgi:hypothetical protein